jgi:hypothetical protein
MTSAYQFSLSKKAQSGHAKLYISNIIEQEPESANDPEPIPEAKQILEFESSPTLKRKAAEISLLTPEEEETEPVSPGHQPPAVPERESMESAVNETEVPEPIPQPPVVAHGDAAPEVRAPKRLRRFAEAVGYVALGGAATGVALLSTLIATAPSFT